MKRTVVSAKVLPKQMRLPLKKGVEAHRVAGPALTVQEPLVVGVFGVEALGVVGLGLGPLLRVVVHLGHVHEELHARGDRDLLGSFSDGGVAVEGAWDGELGDGVQAERLVPGSTGGSRSP